ncbi:hypothetical protein STCU_00644 [Strigomonas culicis]|uniref:(d)CMP kinase n=1 Tax=Strigomonas culicis TaxID=28005 RepID=S9VE02_9TRYP|nr:hypothetical protein STCU_08599 [Strigomonas culicis]EPY27424.1 hypothetical protein STCU_05758 [Strigomonas culicis]EPY36321.1 hypothetical protein STCU_00644 [Strigomonas culicis]|eukprot:EPY21310.1 hypothetical protein STCU_08599 [Strigomonas culicis]
MSKLSAAILRQQDDICSTIVIRLLAQRPPFAELARVEGERIVQRDREDEEKLALGIECAIRRGALPPRPAVSPTHKLNVVGLTSQQVMEKILHVLPSREGNVITLEGLSGTGKGTTVSKLQQALPRCVAWSNGNVFRCYTHLCHEILSSQQREVTAANLTPELLAAVEKRVTFVEAAPGKFETLLDRHRVSEIQNTLLKAPVVSQLVPTVAQATQGEVIRFGAAAVKKLSAAGYNVILEGRAQTLQYIATNLRFELVIPDAAVLGQRRAAQLVMAKALELIKPTMGTAADAEVEATLQAALELLSKK